MLFFAIIGVVGFVFDNWLNLVPKSMCWLLERLTFSGELGMSMVDDLMLEPILKLLMWI